MTYAVFIYFILFYFRVAGDNTDQVEAHGVQTDRERFRLLFSRQLRAT